MEVRFSKLPLQLLLLLPILLYFYLYPLLLLSSFDLITLFSLCLLPQFSFLYHSELQNHLLKENLIMGNGEMVSRNQTIYLNPHGEMKKKTIDKWWYGKTPMKHLILNKMNPLVCFYPNLPKFDDIIGHVKTGAFSFTYFISFHPYLNASLLILNLPIKNDQHILNTYFVAYA